jgi:O-antigen/teichoic acid export membrane protein
LKIKRLFFEYLQRFKANTFFQNIAVVAGGNASAKLIGILSAPVITRIYTPEHFGVFSVFASIIAVLGSVSTFRYASAIPITKDEETSNSVMKLSFLITLSLSFLATLVILFFGRFIAYKFSVPELNRFFWILPLTIIGSGVYQTLNNWAIREKKFRLITRTKVSQGISSNGIKIGLGFLNLKPVGLIIGILANETAGVVSLLSKLNKEKPDFFKTFSIKQTKKVARRYKQFPIYQTSSQLLLNLSTQMPVFFLSSFYGAHVVGIFGLAQNIINMPMNLLAQSVSQVYFAEIAHYGKNNADKIYKLTISIIKKLFLISIIPISILMIFGPWIFKTVFGPEWHDAGLYARYLSLIIIARFISNPLGNIFLVFEKQNIQLILNVIRLALIISIFLICDFLMFPPLKMIMVYSVCLMIYRFFIIFIALNLIKKNQIANQE